MFPVTGHGTNFHVVPLGEPFEYPSWSNACVLRSRWPFVHSGLLLVGHSSTIVATIFVPFWPVISTHAPHDVTVLKLLELVPGIAAKYVFLAGDVSAMFVTVSTVPEPLPVSLFVGSV
jgi:hypothetical protein